MYVFFAFVHFVHFQDSEAISGTEDSEQGQEDDVCDSLVCEESPVGAAMEALQFLNDPENTLGFDFFTVDCSPVPSTVSSPSTRSRVDPGPPYAV